LANDGDSEAIGITGHKKGEIPFPLFRKPRQLN